MIDSLANLAMHTPMYLISLKNLVTAEDWKLRASAILLLVRSNTKLLLEIWPTVLEALNDHRGLESWPARITAAELLLNEDIYTNLAIDTMLVGLEYDSTVIFPRQNASNVRKQAALALGKLKAAYRQPRVIEKVVFLFDTEQNPQVLDGLYNALTSLAAAPELE